MLDHKKIATQMQKVAEQLPKTFALLVPSDGVPGLLFAHMELHTESRLAGVVRVLASRQAGRARKASGQLSDATVCEMQWYGLGRDTCHAGAEDWRVLASGCDIQQPASSCGRGTCLHTPVRKLTAKRPGSAFDSNMQQWAVRSESGQQHALSCAASLTWARACAAPAASKR